MLCFHPVSAPIVNVQPTDATVRIGDTVSFTVVASGIGLSYQWFGPDRQPLTDTDGEIEGSRTANVQIFNVEPDDTGEYFVRVSNADGSVTSKEAVLLIGECNRVGV